MVAWSDEVAVTGLKLSGSTEEWLLAYVDFGCGQV